MRKALEGSQALAQTVARCRPQVVAAYPITPQTHIVENIAKLVADGQMQCELVSVESEFSAASLVLGAACAGSRTYTASASQGIMLMAEVLYNIAGLRVPMVLTCANRAVSAPLSIWNDQQDSMAVRDAGWQPGNVDCAVVLDQPKLAPVKAEMEQNLSSAVGAPVTVKGRRSEGVGSLGRGEGIVAWAVALVFR